MRLIAFSLFVSLWLAVDRIIVLAKASFDTKTFLERVSSLVNAGQTEQAVQYCKSHDKPASRVIAAGLEASGKGKQAYLAAMDEVALKEMPLLEMRTGFLALMGNVATLMGLFGTIIGLIESFGAVGTTGGDKAVGLAKGISEAMNCTAFGLLTGISALASFSFLNGKTQALLDETNHITLRVFRLWKRNAQANGLIPAEDASKMKAIGAPVSHLGSNVGLFCDAQHGRGHKSTFASLQLTPLIDMFIVMVIFLLQVFGESGELTFVNESIRMPFASQVDALETAPIISISYPQDDPMSGVVTIKGVVVGTTGEMLQDDNPDLKLEELTNQLEQLKEAWKQSNIGKPFLGNAIIHCDQAIDFKIIKRVLYSATLAGYSKLHFAVQKVENS